MVQSNDIVTIQITDFSDQGQGIGKADGLAVFVAAGETVPGDMARVRLTKIKKRMAFGQLEELLDPSPWRIPSFCPYAQQCGGCSYAETSMEGQLQIKEQQVRNALQRLGGVQEPCVCQMVSSDKVIGYRNKAVMQISTGGNIKRKGGRIENLSPAVVGFFRGKSHEVIDCPACRLQTGMAMAAAQAVRRFMREDHITAWDPKWEQGLMDSMTVRTAFGTGEVMVILTLHGRAVPNGSKLLDMLDEAIADAGGTLTSVMIQCVRKGSISKWIPFAGNTVIHDRLGSLRLEISPPSFYQINPDMTIRLYDQAKDYAALTGTERVLDLYCGTGTIGLWMARSAGAVLGIESQPQAVLDANRNAVLNGIVNVRYLCGKAEHLLPALLQDSGSRDHDRDEDMAWKRNVAQHADVVLLDPPRAGCRQELLAAVVRISPRRIVYLSCNPATLARDVRILTKNGYRFQEATPFNQFPWTRHTECVALLVSNRPQTG